MSTRSSPKRVATRELSWLPICWELRVIKVVHSNICNCATHHPVGNVTVWNFFHPVTYRFNDIGRRRAAIEFRNHVEVEWQMCAKFAAITIKLLDNIWRWVTFGHDDSDDARASDGFQIYWKIIYEKFIAWVLLCHSADKHWLLTFSICSSRRNICRWIHANRRRAGRFRAGLACKCDWEVQN